MDNRTMLLSMLIAHYQEMCPIVSMEELVDHSIRIRLNVHKDYEYVTLPDNERVKRGKQFGSRLKELLSHQTFRPVIVQFKVVDRIPTPEEYVNLIGLDYDNAQLFLRTVKKNTRPPRQ